MRLRLNDLLKINPLNLKIRFHQMGRKNEGEMKEDVCVRHPFFVLE